MSVTTQRTPSPPTSAAPTASALVDDEHVDEPLVARGDPTRLGAARQALEHPVGGAFQRAAADDRADGDARDPALFERSPDLRDGEDRPDRYERVARSDDDQLRRRERVEHTGGGRRRRLAVEAHAVDLVPVLPRDEPFLEGEGAGRRVDPGSESVVRGG